MLEMVFGGATADLCPLSMCEGQNKARFCVCRSSMFGGCACVRVCVCVFMFMLQAVRHVPGHPPACPSPPGLLGGTLG